MRERRIGYILLGYTIIAWIGVYNISIEIIQAFLLLTSIPSALLGGVMVGSKNEFGR